MEVQTAEGSKLIRFENAIIAAGSQSVKLGMFPWDDERILDSTRALELKDVPKKLLVVGGGIIGLEMATVYSALGSEVTVVEFMDQIIPGADADLIKPLAQRLGKKLKGIHLKTKVTAAKATKKGIEISYEGDSIPETSAVRSRAGVGRPLAERRQDRCRQGRRGGRAIAASSTSTRRCAPMCRTSSPSATWSASRCWRTRRRTRPRWRPKSWPA